MFSRLAAPGADAAPSPGARRLAEATADDPLRVAVVARPLADPVARLLVGWSLLAGGALVLEPHPAALVATAAWARPTLFAGSGEEIGRLAGEARRHERSYAGGWARRLLALLGRPAGPRLPFGRLRTIVEIGGGEVGAEAPAADGDDFWSERGVRRLAAAELISS